MAADFIQGTNLFPSCAKQTFGTSAKFQRVSAEIQKLIRLLNIQTLICHQLTYLVELMGSN
jgi:hypothetical protein